MIDPAAFDSFFEAVWGQRPFAWQSALARRVLASQAEGRSPAWPDAIALATASGKTACIDIAVFCLAAQADRMAEGQPVTAPRRVFFVVDRRVIVDEALDRARTLAGALVDANSGVLRDVADRLRRVGGDGPLPLAAQALRGGQLRSDDWAASPLQPTVVASTVDQVGSRLLFRGYGVGSGMWPVHASLVGNDALILLDEAHCAQPMLDTLQAVRRYRALAAEPLPAPFEVTVLSATPPAGLADVFRDDSAERLDPDHPLGRRQTAAKPARLVICDGAKGRNSAKLRAELAGEMARQALELAVASGQAAAVVVFCNRVDTARRVHALLSKDGADAHLLTGRMRPIDKDDTITSVLAPLATKRAGQRRLARPCFVVATQTLEVGADLDFDLLVTECASLDALRQRFGRLNRGGRPFEAAAVIVATPAQIEPGADDPVYGDAIGATWGTLVEWSAGSGTIDFGIAALEPRIAGIADLAPLCAPSQRAPVLLPAHLDVLAQTSPVPQPTPALSLYLHGPRSGPADVQVCWRADLGVDDPAAGLDSLLRCPPAAPECLPVPFAQMRRWLNGETADGGADIEGESTPVMEDDAPRTDARPRRVLRWRGRDGSATIEGGLSLRPGDMLVIPAALGGFDELATLGSAPVADWGDRAHAAMRPHAVLRLNDQVLAQWPAGAQREALVALVTQGRSDWEDDPMAFAERLRESLSAWAEALIESKWQWLRDIVAQAASMRRLDRCLSPHPCGGWIVEIRRPRPRATVEALTTAFFSDEDDAASSGHFRSLLIEPMGDGRSHLQAVGALALHYARCCGLSSAMVDAMGRAGEGHDLGKADPRFQAMLRGGTPWLGGSLLAKSPEMPQSREAAIAARQRSGYPDGARHELLSVRLLESSPGALPTDPALRDLVLHLVESHHGYCRPFAPVVFDEAPVTIRVSTNGRRFEAASATGLDCLDAGPAERFWSLTRRHGWWGLAWLEALLRLADHRRSSWEQQQGG
ncbi:MAG: type I-U CRISPR-associated helicase/endonuclease Cas3 [Burkholderiales bacterium]|nr:type I-U CRISPR-associated helicase/endonuclease Cas3 [Burkholderiales bacterium]MDE2157522.1 type I-U CRISPR-associated helicase/endonuclease Cas3 [Burkholderiales bacterium]MDE2501728.1 type I-U CRISPR-associated helicase/endonuclease Cas3 [Burkholderiales bacterium]